MARPTTHSFSLYRGLLFILLVPAVLGCGGGHQRDTAPVAGKVTLNGKPLTAGYITVTPESGRLAKGTIQPDGTFVLSTYSDGDGVQLGTHPVTVSMPVEDELSQTNTQVVAIPLKYSRASSSGLTITVKDQRANEVLFVLDSE